MNKKTIALGISDFKKVIEGNHYLVDKSLFIKEAIEDGAEVVLLPRPRRWGKTLNMSMLKYFFEKTENSNRYLFNDLAVEKYPKIFEHQGKYPVIFLTFKDAKQLSWDLCYAHVRKIIAEMYKEHQYLMLSDRLSVKEKEIFQLIMDENAEQHSLQSSLKNLSQYLHQYYNVAPIILIDEYDAPVISGFENGYYREIVNFIQTFLSAGLKDNLHLKKGFLTGILRVAKESIFSGLNNLSVCTLLNNQYSECFGFSESDVVAMLDYYHALDSLDQVRAWYNGYQVGRYITMYNPWSVLSYVKTKELLPHWMNSANNNLIKKMIQNNSAAFKSDLEYLMLGKTTEKERLDFVTFDSLYTSSNVAFNFLLLTGYLSFEKRYFKGNREYLSLMIPNEEIKIFYEDVVIQWFEETLSLLTYQNMLKDLIEGNIKEFKKFFERVVQQCLSYHDVSGQESEKFYHMFVLGMFVCLQETHEVKSNRESGSGRYDVMIIPKDITKIGIIIEFKIADNETDQAFNEAIDEAHAQIKDKNYQAELEARGITQIINVAIVFSGKRTLVSAKS